MAATDTESIHDNMTRLRMRMVQQKLTNERDRLQQRPSSVSSSDDNVDHLKIQQAMLRRQELLDRIRQEQFAELNRPRSYSERRRFTPTPLPPPSRHSLPDLHRHFHVNHSHHYRDKNPQAPRSAPSPTRPAPKDGEKGPEADMSQVKHVIEHKFRSPETQVQTYQLPPIASPPAIIQPAIAPSYTAIQSPPPIITTLPAHIQTLDYGTKQDKGSWFNKGDFMDMMMFQNAQMHHMAMQQLMVKNLTPQQQQPPVYPVTAPVMPAEPYVMPRPVYHHHYSAMAAPAAPMMYHHSQMPNYDYGRGSRYNGSGLRGGDGGGSRSRFKSRNYRSEFPPNTKKTPNPAIPFKRLEVKYPFPGSENIRRLRHVAYCAWFIACLRASLKKNKGNRPSSVFLFGIILKEIVAALHRLYLNPTGNIYPVMADVIGPNAKDLSSLVGGRNITRDQAQLLQILAYVVENLVFHITEIMPPSGVLGTHKKAAVFELIKNGQRFPDGYFWQVELDRFQFTSDGRTSNLGNQEAFLLLLGIFFSRSLITTLLLKPIDYGLSTEPLSETHQRNLKVLSTVLLFIVRRASAPRGQRMMPMPGEVAKYVFKDDEMRGVHISLRKTYEYCENMLREWGAEYIKRLRDAGTSVTGGEGKSTKK